MEKPRICFIGTYSPRRCGIATFTSDLARSVGMAGAHVDVIAMDDGEGPYAYPDEVVYEVRDNDRDAYLRAAEFINAKKYDLICVQHEYGIFGDQAGRRILDLVRHVNPPIVVTLHTVLTEPPGEYREVMEELITLTDRVVVMSPRGKDILQEVHGVEPSKVVVIPHGVPNFPTGRRAELRKELGYEGKKVVMTFGLIAPDKGLEFMIRALPSIREEHPEVLYTIIGETHPHVKAAYGEAYRKSLLELAEELGVSENLRVVNRYVDLDELTRLLVAADLYVTPYLKREQITSGTLAYAVGAGKAVVSTPYWHAEELLADDVGVIVPSRDADALAEAVGNLFANEDLRKRHEERAFQAAQTMRWDDVGGAYRELFLAVVEDSAVQLQSLFASAPQEKPTAVPLPVLSLEHLLRMTDDTGLFQHAKFDVPNRWEGYCLDDNARALLLVTSLARATSQPARLEALEAVYLSFIDFAWNPVRKCFRNFMAYDRRWLEECGSADSNGRALWALGTSAARATNPGRRQLAKNLFLDALHCREESADLRPLAFTILGCDAYLSGYPADESVREAMKCCADQLEQAYHNENSETWLWFEDALTYDNARLPQAMLVAWRRLDDDAYRLIGLRALRWLISQQTSPEGLFDPIGCNKPYRKNRGRATFDQQPLEVAATIDACVEAFALTGDRRWMKEAERAFAWMLGANVVGVQIADPKIGACADGLQPSGINRNYGAESTLAYLCSLDKLSRLRAEGWRSDSSSPKVA